MTKKDAPSSCGIYLHIPYCIKKCPYCDFNSYGIGHNAEPFEKKYVNALIAELKHYAALPGWKDRTCHSLFFGGGTPSLFSPESIETIIREISERFDIYGAEITLEANPGTIQETLGIEKLSGFRSAGINRVSMGAQGFSASKLKTLGRLHSPEDTANAVKNIRAAGFENFNIDLIFGVQGETLPDWEHDLRCALELDTPHLSAYCLTIERGTDYWRLHQRGELVLPTDDVQAEMYMLNQSLLAEHGYEQYEVSNFAKPGRACRHNLGYWSGEDYLALGAGAHGYMRTSDQAETFGLRWSNIPGPDHYIERAVTKGDATQRTEQIDREQAELEFFFLGLRTSRGISRTSYENTFGAALDTNYEEVIETFTQNGCLEQDKDILRLTQKGFLFTDEVLKAFA